MSPIELNFCFLFISHIECNLHLRSFEYIMQVLQTVFCTFVVKIVGTRYFLILFMQNLLHRQQNRCLQYDSIFTFCSLNVICNYVFFEYIMQVLQTAFYAFGVKIVVPLADKVSVRNFHTHIYFLL